MNRTHRPRGSLWTCASSFQQCERIRDINFDDAEALDARLCRQQFPDSDRAAKRRRIEQIADDYLNGNTPLIRCATLSSGAIRTALSRAFPRPSGARAAFDAVVLPQRSDNDVIWQDIKSDAEALHSFNLRHELPACDRFEVSPLERKLIVTGVRASANCRRGLTKRLSSMKATRGLGPSREALQKAAELRSRRERTTTAEPGSCSRPLVPETQRQSSLETTQDTASDHVSPTPTWTSRKWLQSGLFERPRKIVDEECSRDELGVSSLSAPSQRSRIHVRPLFCTHAGISQLCLGFSDFTGVSTGQAAPAFNDTAEHQLQLGIHSSAEFLCQQFQTAPEDLASDSADGEYDESQSDNAQDDGHQQLPGHQKNHAGLRSSSPKTNRAHCNVLQNNNTVLSAVTEPVVTLSIPLNFQPHQPSEREEGKPLESRGTQSMEDNSARPTPQESSRRRSAPTEPQLIANETAQLSVEQQHYAEVLQDKYNTVARNNCASPFLFRKRGESGLNYLDDRKVEPASADIPKRLTDLSLAKIVLKNSEINFAENEDTATADAQQHTPLEIEQFNKVIPTVAASGHRSSPTKKALSMVLGASGAELSQCDAVTSLLEPQDVARNKLEWRQTDATSVVKHIPQLETESQQGWFDTQVVLAQAKKELFVSQNKTQTTNSSCDKTAPPVGNLGRGANKTARKPLPPLFRESMPIPNTQALLDDWKGWSSIKKPWLTQRGTNFQSPCLNKGSIPSDQSGDSPSHEKSSLRFPLSFDDSLPGHEDDTILSSMIPDDDTATPTADSIFDGFRKSASKPGTPSTPTLGHRSLEASHTTHAQTWTDLIKSLSEPITVLQDAQPLGAGDSQDSQALAYTVAELENDVLGTVDDVSGLILK